VLISTISEHGPSVVDARQIPVQLALQPQHLGHHRTVAGGPRPLEQLAYLS
jgi:hypothetical protein